MAAGLKKKPKAVKADASGADAPGVLYLYAISQKGGLTAEPAAIEGIDGEARVEAVACEGQLCWISRVSREEFAERLSENMQNLDWLANAGLRHQRAVSAISRDRTALPARFGTVFLTELTMAQHVRERKGALKEAFELVSDADEWGIKVFALPKSRAVRSAQKAPASGADYLKRKAASRQPKGDAASEADLRAFAEALSGVAVASSPGGKASAGQPGLLWHGSFLIKRKDRKKLEAVLKKAAVRWQGSRRIDWSGPWPPYSFVGAHAE